MISMIRSPFLKAYVTLDTTILKKGTVISVLISKMVKMVIMRNDKLSDIWYPRFSCVMSAQGKN